jgi:hypothetical protein
VASRSLLLRFATPDNHFNFFDRRTLLSWTSIQRLNFWTRVPVTGFCYLLRGRKSSATTSATPIAPSSGISDHDYSQCASTTTTQQHCSSQSWEKHSSTGGHYGRSSCLYVPMEDCWTSTLLMHTGPGLRYRRRDLSRWRKTSTHTLATTQILSCRREGAQRASLAS